MDSQNETHQQHDHRLWKSHDRFQAGLLVGFSLLLLPVWRLFLAESIGMGDLLAGSFLPAALGFLLVLRRGTVDLSVWAVMGAGGLVGAWVINACSASGPASGWALPVAIVAAMLLGALVGCLNAVIHLKFRVPAFIVTLLTGLVVLGLSHVLFSAPVLAVPDDAFDPWVSGLTNALTGWIGDGVNLLDGPLIVLRMLVVFLAWTCVLAVLMAYDSAERKKPHPRLRHLARPASLIASGALAALSGVCWLIDEGQVPVPTRLVDGLTIPAAVILAGGFLLRGPGRTKLAVICLPPALLLTDVWEFMVWPITVWGYSASLAALCFLTFLAQRAFVVGHHHFYKRRKKQEYHPGYRNDE